MPARPSSGEEIFAGLKPYSRTKDSGVERLGEVPAHWEVKKLRSLLRSVVSRNRPELPLLSVVREHGVIIRDLSNMDDNHNYVPDDLSGYKVVQEGQFAMNKMKAWQGSYGVSKCLGLVSPAYFVFALRGVDGEFFHWAIRSMAYVPRFTMASDGVRVGQWDLSRTRMREISVAVPANRNEQAAITRFLDQATSRIERYISAKEKLVALLEEQKRIIIHDTITGRIDVRTGKPYPAYKPSGIEWARMLPEGWNTERIQRLARRGYKMFTDGDWIESPYITSSGVRLIQTGNIGAGQYKEQGFRYISEATFSNFRCTEVVPGDILICRLGEPVARACLAPNLANRMITSVDVCILKTREDVSSNYLVYAMSSWPYLSWVGSLVRGSTRDRVSRAMVGSFRLPLPSLEEQIAIARFLDHTIANITSAIACGSREIELLREFRARLIADVVTGKIDVREAASAHA